MADHEGIRAPSASKLVAGLEARGLAERRTDPADRRRVLIALSAEGAAFLDDVRAAGMSWLSARLSELPADQLEILEKAIPVLEQLLEARQ